MGNREPLASSQQAVQAFVDLLHPANDRAGLATYAWAGALDQPLTDAWPALKQHIGSYNAHGATALPAGMKAANDELILSGLADGLPQRCHVVVGDSRGIMVDRAAGGR